MKQNNEINRAKIGRLVKKLVLFFVLVAVVASMGVASALAIKDVTDNAAYADTTNITYGNTWTAIPSNTITASINQNVLSFNVNTTSYPFYRPDDYQNNLCNQVYQSTGEIKLYTCTAEQYEFITANTNTLIGTANNSILANCGYLGSVTYPNTFDLSMVNDIPDNAYVFGWYNYYSTSVSRYGTYISCPISIPSRIIANSKVYDCKYYINNVLSFDEDVRGNTVLETPTLNGYKFEGWYTNNSFTAEHNGVITSDVVLYAKFVPIQYQYVAYGQNGVIIKNGNVNFGETFNIASITVPSVEGYDFGGWYTDSEYTTAAPQTVTVNNDITLYAKYNIKSYTVSFIGLNSSVIMTSTVNYGADMPVCLAPAQSGYNFVGWYTTPNFTNEFTATTVTSNMSVYARYTPIIRNVVIYGHNNQVVYSASLNYGQSLLRWFSTSVPEVSGYTYNGAYCDSLFTQTYTTSTAITNDIELYLKYTKNNYIVNIYGFDSILHTLTFSGGVAVPASDLEAPAVEGYTFTGWYNESNFATNYDSAQTVEGNKNIYAKYIGNTYTCNIYGYDGVVLNTATVGHGTQLASNLLSAPIVNYYTFAGWYMDSSFETEFNISTAITSKCNVYAKYTINQYVVSIHNNNQYTYPTGQITYTANAGSLVDSNLLEYQNINGYTFEGWYLDKNFISALNLSAPIESDLHIYAYYSKNMYTFNVYGFNGTLLHTGEVQYNSSISADNFVSTVVTGYTFDGWYRDNTFTNVFNSSLGITDNINVYAKYVLNKYNVVLYGFNDIVLYSGICQYGDSLPVAIFEAPSVTGYEIEGFYSDRAFTAEINEDNGIYTNTAIYVKYEKLVFDYAVYSFNNVELANGEVEYGAMIPIVLPEEIAYYVFDGWYTDTTFTTSFDFTKPVTGAMSIYAKYIEDDGVPIYTVRVLSTIDNSVLDTFTLKNGKSFAVSTVTVSAVENYTFVGFKLEDGTALTAPITITGDTDVYATFTAIPQEDDDTANPQIVEEEEENAFVTFLKANWIWFAVGGGVILVVGIIILLCRRR